MARRFRHLNEDWEVAGTGTGHGVGVGDSLPAITEWGVVFTSMTRPDRGTFRSSISVPDPARADENELRSALDEQLIVAAIDRSKYIWRPAEAIAKELGLETDYVRDILENTAPDVIAGNQNQQGLWLYTTREHLSKTTGDVMKRFYDVEESS